VIVPTTSYLSQLSHRIRFLALLIAAVLLAAVILAVSAGQQPSSRSQQHYLGIHGLELAAFDGKATITLALKFPSGLLKPPALIGSAAMPLESVSWDVSAPDTVGSGEDASNPTGTTFALTREIDEYTPSLLTATAVGLGIQSATITIQAKPTAGVKAAGLEKLEYKLTSVLISGDSEKNTLTGSNEVLTMTYNTAELDYFRGGKLKNSGLFNADTE
jgi:type VI protein secretion system component Hcp